MQQISPMGDNRETAVRLLIIDACKTGGVTYLRELFDGKTGEDVKELVSFKLEGTTPLISASRSGRLEMVKFLIKECDADVTLCGSVMFDGETIEGAPPLWCAAAAGHLDIVKCLIENDADPNCRTLTNSTPMRAACFDGHYRIVEFLIAQGSDIEIANRHQHTSLMIACYKGHANIVRKLLSSGAYVNRISIKKNTALHDCAENGSIEVAKLLIANGAVMQRDINNISPVMTTALAGHPRLLKYFCEHESITIREQIASYELLGATFLDAKHSINPTCEYWEKAIEMRRKHNYPLASNPEHENEGIFSELREPTTKEELQDIALDMDNMRLLSLMVRERVLGPTHPDTTYFIRYRGAVYADSGNFEKCIDLWLYALKLQQKNMEPLYHLTLSSLMSFCELFHFLLTRRGEDEAYHKLDYNLIIRLIEHSINEILRKSPPTLQLTGHSNKTSSTTPQHPAQSASDSHACPTTPTNTDTTKTTVSGCARYDATWQRVCRVMMVTLHLVGLSIRALEIENKWAKKTSHDGEAAEVATQKPEFCPQRAALLYRIRHVTDHHGRTLLHLASSGDTCSLSRSYHISFPHHQIIESLLYAQYDPNKGDHTGLLPLHYAAESFDKRPLDAALKTFHTLVQGGGHVDYCDKHGNSPLDVLGKERKHLVGPVSHQKLSCLCSRVVFKMLRENPSLRVLYLTRLGYSLKEVEKH